MLWIFKTIFVLIVINIVQSKQDQDLSPKVDIVIMTGASHCPPPPPPP